MLYNITYFGDIVQGYRPEISYSKDSINIIFNKDVHPINTLESYLIFNKLKIGKIYMFGDFQENNFIFKNLEVRLFDDIYDIYSLFTIPKISSGILSHCDNISIIPESKPTKGILFYLLTTYPCIKYMLRNDSPVTINTTFNNAIDEFIKIYKDNDSDIPRNPLDYLKSENIRKWYNIVNKEEYKEHDYYRILYILYNAYLQSTGVNSITITITPKK